MCSFAAPPSPFPHSRLSVHLSHDLSALHHVSLSCDLSVRHPASPTVCLSTCKSVKLSVHTTASPSIIPVRPSYEQSVHPPITLSMTHLSTTPPVSPANCPSGFPSPSDHLYTALPRPSGCPTSSDHTSTILTSLSDLPSLPDHLYILQPSPSDHLPLSHHLYNTPISPSACPSSANCLVATMTHPPIHPSSPTIHCTQDSSQSLAVVNGEQSQTIHLTQDSSQSIAVMNGEHSRKAKKFHKAFSNYNLLLCALDASSIYLRDSKRVAPPKSGEDAHVTCGRCDFGGTTLNKSSLGFSYVLPGLWDPGGVRSPPNVPRDRSKTLAPSRYPYAPRTGHLVDLPNL